MSIDAYTQAERRETAMQRLTFPYPPERSCRSTAAAPQRDPAYECNQRTGCLALAIGLLLGAPAWADGLNATGVVGGLTIPTAHALGDGTVALAVGGVREHQITGDVARNVSYALGVGLLPGLDMVGRFTENATRDFSRPGFTITRGISDLSLNFKASLALDDAAQAPRIAIGLNDVTGGAVNFKAVYGVFTLPMGLVDATVGYGRSSARARPGYARALDGAFGGLSLRLIDGGGWGGVTASAEYDVRQPLLGLQWHSRPLDVLGGATLTTAVHHAFDRGLFPDATVLTAGVAMPLGDTVRRLAAPGSNGSTRPPSPAPVSEVARESASARLGQLQAALQAAGLERVRVGSAVGDAWVLQFESRRWGHSELDALGVALGLAAEYAPASVGQVMLVALKAAQPVLTLRTPMAAWRQFMTDGLPGPLRASMQVVHGDGLGPTPVDWLSDAPSPASVAQVRLVPVLANSVGTEFAAFDYALAARAELGVPLWAGGHMVATAQQRLFESRNAADGRPFSAMRAGQGLRTLALHQSLWWGQQALLGAAAGLFEGKAAGAEAEMAWFVAGRDDVVHLRGRLLDRNLPSQFLSRASGGATYRWASWSDVWVEGGWQRYTDGSSGPSLSISRWWGDVGLHLNYRRGGDRQYAGLEFSFPLTPRLAPATGRIQWLGASRWRHGIRTRITDSGTAANLVEFEAVRDFRPSWSLMNETLDGGRSGPAHVLGGLLRLRESATRWRGMSP
jgi:hypothetical protein